MNKNELLKHVGHNISCVLHGDAENPMAVIFQCEDCKEILYTETNKTMIELLKGHAGHNLSCVYYGVRENPMCVSVECEDCYEVLFEAMGEEVEESQESNTVTLPMPIVLGDYVLSPCKNAFNDKTSYWISKKGYAKAYYAFTPLDNKDLERQLTDASVESYIRMYEEMGEH